MFRDFWQTFYSIYSVHTEYISSKSYPKNFTKNMTKLTKHTFLTSKHTFLTSNFRFWPQNICFWPQNVHFWPHKVCFVFSETQKHGHFRYPKPVQNYRIKIRSKFLRNNHLTRFLIEYSIMFTERIALMPDLKCLTLLSSHISKEIFF